MPQDKGQCLWKDHCPLLEANSILIEILMLEKSAISLPPRTPRILCALRGGHRSIRGKREKGTHGDSPCNPVRWDVFLHQQKSLHKVCCYKSESWSSYWGSKGQCLLDRVSSLSEETTRVLFLSPLSTCTPGTSPHQWSSPTISTLPRSDWTAGIDGEGHINRTTDFQGQR